MTRSVFTAVFTVDRWWYNKIEALMKLEYSKLLFFRYFLRVCASWKKKYKCYYALHISRFIHFFKQDNVLKIWKKLQPDHDDSQCNREHKKNEVRKLGKINTYWDNSLVIKLMLYETCHPYYSKNISQYYCLGNGWITVIKINLNIHVVGNILATCLDDEKRKRRFPS